MWKHIELLWWGSRDGGVNNGDFAQKFGCIYLFINNLIINPTVGLLGYARCWVSAFNTPALSVDAVLLIFTVIAPLVACLMVTPDLSPAMA